ncbi:MAG: D-alanine--D-alanine ligase family protein [Sporolactobacillus sp.]|uniref:D-alanine--D-alanine ligase family protein n=1 Tax=Sporolactobacillus sp. STSJ-5 TaxID=2965076 RepID=UPI00210495A5|nr:D-alanine--D-alanine ligase family protein [Sporolactobacillus sp. STSJ-5]MCQ2009201.1 D-alanine--D-alanine ligase [Sporolactobacillus sp. STSJ-5]
MTKVTVGVLFGGHSAEYKISLKSAYSIITSLDTEKYELVLIGITQDGSWKRYTGQVDAIPSDTWSEQNCVPAWILPDKKLHGLIEQHHDQLIRTHLDVVFPVLHGKNGEDGTIQGLLELSGIPYVGCNVLSSSMGMDKDISHRIVKDAGFRVPETVSITGKSSKEQLEKISVGLSYPVFVKPANGGSSFGVTKVADSAGLLAAVVDAQNYDSKICIEEGIDGCEVGCSILGNGDDLTVGEVDQIVLSHGFFRIHQESHPETDSENSTIRVPADVSSDVEARIKQTAKAIYSALGCTGLTRVDMFLTPDHEVVFNEINTMPGFTSYSRYPRMMKAAGISLTQVTDTAIQLALQSK